VKTFLLGEESAKRIKGFGWVLGRPVGRWEDNTIIGCRETDWKDVDWTKLDEGRSKRRAVVNKVMNIQVL
jgi:hypothetical protein